MRFSIITVTFNSRSTIDAACQSLYLQTYPNVQHVVVDGGSKDGTLERLELYRNKIDVLISEPDSGLYDALNKGTQLCTGDVIGLLHADDMYSHAQVLEMVAKRFFDSDCDLTYSDLDFVGRTNPNRVIRKWRSGPFQHDRLLRGWMVPHPTLFIRKEVVLSNGPYSLKYHTASDYDFMLGLLMNPYLKWEYIPEVLVKMRLGGLSNQNMGKILQKSWEDLQIMRERGLPHPIRALMYKNFSKLPQLLKI